MARVAIFLFLFFAALLVLRLIRVFLAARLRGASRPTVEGEMVRDPVCGTWVDRRIALAGRKGGEWFPVCSEKCRQSLESA
jgi:YHS domain-containing protein